jgi:hypothetical protein
LIPLSAFVLIEARTRVLRRHFALKPPKQRELVTAAVSLALLPALVGIAATQPVLVHKAELTQRLDTQLFLFFDTSLSMSARTGPHGATRLARAKQEARALIPQLGNIPVGVATMTDRVLPCLMPDTNSALVLRTVDQSVQINEPPPSRNYHGRASTFNALIPLAIDGFFPTSVKHPIVVIFTDGEEQAPPPPIGQYGYAGDVTIPPIFVHIWAPTERIYVQGHIDPSYRPDPTSGAVLTHFAALTHGHVFSEGDIGGLLGAIRAEAGSESETTKILGLTRIELGPWLLLAGILPLAYLLWQRNV